MLSSLAKLVLLPLILMLSGCGSPDMVPLSEMPGISKGPGSPQTSQGQESGQEASQEARQLLATPKNPIPQSECSYQCSKLGFHHGGKCAHSYCRCLVEHREAKTLWKGWVSQGICSPITLESPEYQGKPCRDDSADPHKCDFPRQKSSNPQYGLCGPPGFVDSGGWTRDWGYVGHTSGLGYATYGSYNGKEFIEEDVCELWARALPLEKGKMEQLRLGEEETPVCVRFADISYACSA